MSSSLRSRVRKEEMSYLASEKRFGLTRLSLLATFISRGSDSMTFRQHERVRRYMSEGSWSSSRGESFV